MKDRKCPKCKLEYKRPPSISRLDNKTEICELCGTAESMAIFKMAMENKMVELSIVKETKIEKEMKKELKERGQAYYIMKDGTKIELEPLENIDKI